MASGVNAPGPGEFKYFDKVPGKNYNVSSVSVPAQQAENAATKAKSMVGANTYNPVTNSCVSCAKQVLKSGGINTGSLIFTPKQLEQSFKRVPFK